jgi:hypothetical protein
MRDVTAWKRGTLASRSRREAIQLPPRQGVLGAVLHGIIPERPHPGDA